MCFFYLYKYLRVIDTKYKSFLKQMSIYGFEKFGERNDWCFYHCHFRKNFPDDLYMTTIMITIIIVVKETTPIIPQI